VNPKAARPVPAFPRLPFSGEESVLLSRRVIELINTKPESSFFKWTLYIDEQDRKKSMAPEIKNDGREKLELYQG
jgi:hypothetical protein